MYLFLLFLFLGLTLFYVLLFEYFKSGWYRLPEYHPEAEAEIGPDFSILIPARNERKNIIPCLEGLVTQHYPSPLFEIIVMDDFSEDETAEAVRDFINSHPQHSISLVRMRDYPPLSGPAYKKAAIQAGVNRSKYNWIITTDADCTRNEHWLGTIAAFIKEEDPVMISAPVAFTYNKGFFQQAQALEFLGLIAIGGACIYKDRPILCNGANLIYRKSAFHAVDGFKDIDTIASGDDELLMHKIHHQYPGKVRFLKNEHVIVHTHPCSTLGEFITQRKRWVSKSSRYKNKRITLVLALSYLFNLSIFVGLLIGLDKPIFLTFAAFMLFAKIVTEYAFYRRVMDFFKEYRLLKWCIPASLTHIIYVLFIGIYGNFGRYKWKGRSVR